jgi:hypothetical protein
MVWFFERGAECLTLDICRNAAAYEVHVQHPDGTRTLEFAGTAQQLVERMDAIPHALIAAGWHPRPQRDFAPPVSRPGSNDKS